MRTLGLIAFSLLFSTQCLAANPRYTEPKGESDQLAYIVGSKGITTTTKPSVVYVWGIDRQEVRQAEGNWSKPVPVMPGIHKVTVALKGVYQEFDIDFCAGCLFQANVSYSEESSMMFKKLTSDFWVTRQPEAEVVTEHRPGKPIPVNVFLQAF